MIVYCIFIYSFYLPCNGTASNYLMTDAMCIAEFQTYSEEIPIDDIDEIEDIPEVEGDNIPH